MKCFFKEQYKVYSQFNSEYLGVLFRDEEWIFEPDEDVAIKGPELRDISDKIKTLNQRREY